MGALWDIKWAGPGRGAEGGPILFRHADRALHRASAPHRAAAGDGAGRYRAPGARRRVPQSSAAPRLRPRRSAPAAQARRVVRRWQPRRARRRSRADGGDRGAAGSVGRISAMTSPLLVGTRKGLFVMESGGDGAWTIARQEFLGVPVTAVAFDRRD